MRGLVLAGGHGTRLRPLTHGFAKQLIPIANKPVLFYSLEDLRNAGITDVIINVAPHSKDDVISAVGDGSSLGIKVRYVTQEAPLGIAHAVKISKELLKDEPFVVYLGDNILKGGITRYVKRFQESDVDAITLVCPVPNPERFGTVEVEGIKVTKVVEKPKHPTSDLAMVGVYLLKPVALEIIDSLKPSWRNELEMADTYQVMVDKGLKVEAMLVNGWWADTGTPEDLFDVNRLVLDDLTPSNEGTAEEGVIVNGRVRIGKGTSLRAGTVINGPAIIGEDCVVGPNVHVDPYTSIGSKVIIESVQIGESIVMDGSRISNQMHIVQSIIGKEVVITQSSAPPKSMSMILGQNSRLEINGQ